MMPPARIAWPSPTLMPRRLDLESRPFLDEPPPFLCAIGRRIIGRPRAQVKGESTRAAGASLCAGVQSLCWTNPARKGLIERGRKIYTLRWPAGWSLSRLFTDLGVHFAGLGIGAAVAFLPDQGPLALAYFLAARLAYVMYTSLELRAQSLRLGLESPQVAEVRHEAFHRRVLRLQNLDGIAFLSLCVATRSTLPFDGWEPAFLASGIALIVVGFGTKAWAVRCLGASSYTWHDFFVPKEKFEPCHTGPYRFFKDPMYTLGYLQTYGIALLCDSWYGLAASLFAQASILIVNEVVEKPHFRRLCNAVVEPAESP